MNKLKFTAILLIVCSVLCGCGGSAEFDGAAELRTAKKLFEEMNSGSIFVVNNLSDNEWQHFEFTYTADGTLAYVYTASDGENETYYEYHNGSEIVRTTASAGEWTVSGEGTENYYSYSKSNRSSYTSAAFLAFFESCVTSSSVESTEGGKILTMSYDIDGLNSLGMLSTNVGSLTAFSETAEVDKDGYCTKLTQTGTGLRDGEKTDYSYTIIIENINAVSVVECPVPEWEKAA